VNADTGELEAIGGHLADAGQIVVALLSEHAARAVPDPATRNQPAATPRRSGHGGRHAAPGWPLRLLQGGRA
jgi:hypothetical protein